MKLRASIALAAAASILGASVLAIVARGPDRSPSAVRVVATPVPTPTARPSPSPSPAPTSSPTPSATPTALVPDAKVRAAQERLLALGYWLPAANGLKDSHYAHAVTALQKVAGLPRDGILGTASKAALAAGVRPDVRSTSARAIEIDLTRQVLIVAEDGRARFIFDTSTGKPSTPTIAGAYRVYRQYDGLRVSRLGRLWRPKYFDGGRAIHGFTSVPPYAASHGCVRVTYAAIDRIWADDLMAIGTPVLVYLS